MQSVFRSILIELSNKSKKWTSGIKLKNNTWFVFNQDGQFEGRYIFENNDILMISTSSGVIQGKWSIVLNMPGIYVEMMSDSKILVPFIEFDKFIFFKQDLSENIFIFSEDHLTSEQLFESIKREKNKRNPPKITYYFVLDRGEDRGPFTKLQILQMYSNNKISKLAFIRTSMQKNYLNKNRVIDLINNKI